MNPVRNCGSNKYIIEVSNGVKKCLSLIEKRRLD